MKSYTYEELERVHKKIFAKEIDDIYLAIVNNENDTINNYKNSKNLAILLDWLLLEQINTIQVAKDNKMFSAFMNVEEESKNQLKYKDLRDAIQGLVEGKEIDANTQKKLTDYYNDNIKDKNKKRVPHFEVAIKQLVHIGNEKLEHKQEQAEDKTKTFGKRGSA